MPTPPAPAFYRDNYPNGIMNGINGHTFDK